MAVVVVGDFPEGFDVAAHVKQVILPDTLSLPVSLETAALEGHLGALPDGHPSL